MTKATAIKVLNVILNLTDDDKETIKNLHRLIEPGKRPSMSEFARRLRLNTSQLEALIHYLDKDDVIKHYAYECSRCYDLDANASMVTDAAAWASRCIKTMEDVNEKA